jgi:hypothetical protein
VTSAADVVVALLVLAAAGFVPTLYLVGTRWTILPLSILSGAVMSAAAATCFLAIGGSLMAWFVALSVVVAVVTGIVLLVRPVGLTRRRSHSEKSAGMSVALPARPRNTFRFTVSLALVAVAAFCLRGLRTPAIGLDARLFWFLRGGWWLWSQGQALTNMRNFGGDMHAGYPPLISSTVAVAWWISGRQSDEVAVILISIVNTCAAVTAAWALVEFGSSLSAKIRSKGRARSVVAQVQSTQLQKGLRSHVSELPRWCGAGVAVLLIFVFFGVTEPFTTNGYADPLWSVAAAGAVAYLLILPANRAWLGTAVVLLAVAGETKSEGTATVMGILVLICLRSVWRTRRIRLRPVAAASAAIVLLAIWPVLMRLRHVGADMNTSGPRESPLWQRAQAVYDAMSPHLHIVLLAAVLSVVGTYLLLQTRDALSAENILWAWCAALVGLAVVCGAYVFGPGDMSFLQGWLETSAHRVSEFPALTAWWIVASLVVLLAAGPAMLTRSSSDVTYRITVDTVTRTRVHATDMHYEQKDVPGAV